MEELNYKLKCRGIDIEVWSYDSEEVDLIFEDEVYYDNEISFGKEVKYQIDVKVDL